MNVKMHYERKDPEHDESPIISRSLQFETPLKPECVKKVAAKADPFLKIEIVGVVDRVTRFRVDLDNTATTSFGRFLYQVMNWEGNTHHANR